MIGNGLADDLLILKGGCNLKAAMKELQKTTNKLTSWGKSFGLNFNSEKTVVLIFTRRLLNDLPPRLKINNQSIPYSETMRYLEVYLDTKLSWKTHIEKTIKICKQNLMITANMIKKKWRPKPKIARWLFTGIIRPKLTYAAVIWGHCINSVPKSLRHK